LAVVRTAQKKTVTVDTASTNQTAPGRPPKKDDVLDAAVEEFLGYGYAGTTLESIAKRAGVSTATVFKHFRTKADIFGAIMSRVFGNEPNQTIPQPNPGNPTKGLLAIGQHYADSIRDPKIRALFRVVIAEVTRFPELGRQLYEKGKAPYLDRIHGYLKSEVKAGSLAISDVPLATRQFLGMINDVVFWPHMLIVDLQVSDSEVRRVVKSAVNTIVETYSSDRTLRRN
jgi:TetR/AcrR family transcriptional regulator, regulator of autoinduction and epiphytic fitness